VLLAREQQREKTAPLKSRRLAGGRCHHVQMHHCTTRLTFLKRAKECPSERARDLTIGPVLFGGSWRQPPSPHARARPRLLESTLRSTERDPIAAQLVKLLLDNQAYLPLSYSSDLAAVGRNLRGVTGVLPVQRVTGWNVHTWEWGRN